MPGIVAARRVGNPGPSAFTLTDVPANSFFQRSTTTTGPVYASGTYSGPAPSAIEMQVRRTSDNAIVQGWTKALSTLISAGLWSAVLLGVAVSPNTSAGAYIVEARPANAAKLARAGGNEFRIGIGVLCAGQSNMNYMFSVASSPAAAGTGTGFYDVSAGWTSVPAANGVRQLLNGVAANTGVSCFAVNTSKPGTPLYYLRPGNPGSDSDWWNTNTAPQLAAVRDVEIIVLDHGEANAAEGTSGSSYTTQLDGYHGELATAVGRTKTTLPMGIALLGQQITASSGTSDANWEVINRALYAAATGGLTGIFLSHSNIDFPINNTDGFGVHYGVASYAKQGDRFARSIATKLGFTSGYPYFAITATDTVDATHTDVTVAHGLGTDFTPTSAITGFTLSDDAFVTPVTPSAAARTSATKIRLTHSSLSTGSTRKLRYMYGGGSDASALVLDNSALTVPLVQAMAELSPTPLAATPVATYLSSLQTGSSGTSQTTSSITKSNGAGTAVYICVNAPYSQASSVVVTPTTGSAKTAASPLVASSGTDRVTSWWGVVLDSESDFTVTVNYGSSPFTASVVHAFQVANLTSTTPTSTAQSNSYPTNASARTVTLNVSAGGVILAGGETGDGTSISNATITGTETFTKHNQSYLTGTNCTVGSKSGAAANASSSVTVTFPSGGGSPVSMAAIALR